MKIAIDITPIKDEKSLSHRVRGTGFYIENLKKALEKYFPENRYIFFTRTELVPKNVDLIHYPYFEPFFLTLPLRKKIPTIVTVHDLTPLVFPEHFPAGIKGSLKWNIQKLSLRNASAIITDSESSKKDIARFTGIENSKLKVVYLAPGEEFRQLAAGPSADGWQPEIRRKYNLAEKFALYVGDVTWNKNLPRLINAVKQANVSLVMVGKALVEQNFDKNNPWNRDLIKIQQLTEKNRLINKLGFVPTEDLVALYNLATVFVMPSIYEGFGLPVLEAMACGCPVITSKTSSLSEICAEAAILVDPYDTENLAKGIEKMIKDKEERTHWVKKGIIQASKFSWRKTAQDTMLVYRKVYEES